MAITQAGSVGIGTMIPYSILNVAGNGTITGNGRGVIIGTVGDPINTNIPMGGVAGTFEVGFPGWRDTEPTQIGAKIVGMRVNTWEPNNALVQGTELAFYTGTGWAANNPAFHDTSLQRMLIDVDGNVGIGTTNPGAKLEVNGSLKLTAGSGASILFPDNTTQSTAWTGSLCGGDYAETVNVVGDRTDYEPGDVLVIGAESGSDVLKSAEPYSTLVTGIYSTKPGVAGRRQKTDPKTSTNEVPMAMVGIVPTKVSAENGPIKRGDLLVTSSTLGYAMKGTDRGRMLGAIVGKALGNLDSGQGVIEVVVALQ